MTSISQLKNTHRPAQKVQRVGRGFGSHRGKTCGKGGKGDKARSGYKRRYGYEGGQLPLYRKLPRKGFTNGRFKNEVYAVNFALINKIFNDGDVVSYETLRQKGYAPREIGGGFKVLAGGNLEKKVTIEANFFSEAAAEHLKEKGLKFTIVT